MPRAAMSSEAASITSTRRHQDRSAPSRSGRGAGALGSGRHMCSATRAIVPGTSVGGGAMARSASSGARAALLKEAQELRQIVGGGLVDLVIEAARRLASGAAEGVDRLVGGDGVKPGLDRPAFLVLANLEEHLEKGVLEDVLGQGAVAE